MSTLLSFGHGYSARRLTPHLLARGWRVFGTTRSEDKLNALCATGVDPVLFPGGDVAPALAQATHVLISAAPDAGGDPVLKQLQQEICARGKGLQWVGYLSTTGVYGDHAGGWVTEETPTSPLTERGQFRVAAEAAWLALDLPVHVFRLAGIYGPGRGPFRKIRSGRARRIIKPGQVFSRIHVDDIARVLLASLDRPRPGAIYNVCDDVPAPPEDVIAYAANLLNAPEPPAISIDEADLGPMAQSFYAECKRVCNKKLRDELGVELLYPDYQRGLQNVLEEESTATA